MFFGYDPGEAVAYERGYNDAQTKHAWAAHTQHNHALIEEWRRANQTLQNRIDRLNGEVTNANH